MFTRWSLRLEAKAGGVVEIALYDVIGSHGSSAQDVLAQLQAQKPSEIRVLINSAGGLVTEGMAIYSLLVEERRKGTKVTARIDGLCASIATLIALAADTVEMAEGAFWMIHEPSSSGGPSATSSDLRHEADLLDRMREQMLSVYSAKTGKSRDELAALCAAETWFTAAEAKAAGFVNSVIPSQALAAQWDLKPFNKVPKALGAIKMTEEEAKAIKAEIDALRAKNAELEAKLKAKEDAKAEGDEPSEPEEPDTDTEDPEAKTTAAAQVVAVAQMITGIKDVEALPGALMALQTKAKGSTGAKAKHAERVAQAVAEGKLMPSQKAWALSATPKAFDAYLTSMGDNVIVPVGQHHEPNESEAKGRAGNPDTITLTADELKGAKLLGVSPEKFLAKKREALAS